MKVSSLVLVIALALSGTLSAQDARVGTGASSQSTTSASARRNGVSAASNASTAAASNPAAASAGGAMEMNATLSKPIDARLAKAGDEVTATLAQDARGRAGATLPRGTTLIGHLTESQPRAPRSGSAGGDGGSRLGIVFDRAVLADGRELPVAATIQAVASGEAGAATGFRGADRGVGGSAFGAGNASGAASAGGARAVGGIGAAGRFLAGSRGVFGMPGVDLTSGAAGAGQASALTSQRGNVALDRGTRMLLVGEAATGGAAASAAGTGSVAAGARDATRRVAHGTTIIGDASGAATARASTVQ